jgi:hypothetical protein
MCAQVFVQQVDEGEHGVYVVRCVHEREGE